MLSDFSPSDLSEASSDLSEAPSALDTVDHEILVDKLEHYGIRGTAQKLLWSYLSKRSQYVTYRGYESERGEIECGVPQGSVLGPLFFLLYVNDMIKAAKGLDLVLFADDKKHLH